MPPLRRRLRARRRLGRAVAVALAQGGDLILEVGERLEPSVDRGEPEVGHLVQIPERAQDGQAHLVRGDFAQSPRPDRFLDLLRRIAVPSSAVRLSMTLLSGWRQNGQYTRSPPWRPYVFTYQYTCEHNLWKKYNGVSTRCCGYRKPPGGRRQAGASGESGNPWPLCPFGWRAGVSRPTRFRGCRGAESAGFFCSFWVSWAAGDLSRAEPRAAGQRPRCRRSAS